MEYIITTRQVEFKVGRSDIDSGWEASEWLAIRKVVNIQFNLEAQTQEHYKVVSVIS